MNAIVPFQFDTTDIRIEDRDGEPWFVASDICSALDIANHRDALSRLDDDERGSIVVDTLGGPQATAAVNESGLYQIILRSRKAAAKRFRKWVTAEVLPSIRRRGSYGMPAAALDLSDPAVLQRLLLDHTGRAMAIDARIAELEPQAAALARLTDAEGSLCITDAAKALDVPPRRLFAWMEAHGWIYRRSEAGHWVAFQSKLAAGVVEHKATRIERQGKPDKLVEQVMVTPKGLTRLATERAGC